MKRVFLLAGLLIAFSSLHSQNVGVNTYDPLTSLDVRGNGLDSGAVLTLGNSNNSHLLKLFSGKQSDVNPSILWKNNDTLRFATDQNGYNELVRITPDGHVGIGTKNPLKPLHFVSDELYREGLLYENTNPLANGTVIRFTSTNGDTSKLWYLGSGIYGSGQNNFGIGRGNTKFILNDSTGNIGIGTITPDSRLTVAGPTHILGSATIQDTTITSSLQTGYLQITAGAGVNKIIQSDASGKATWVSLSSIGAGVHYIGEGFGGGTVFYVYDNGKHGLIAASADQSTGIQWYNGTNTTTVATRDGIAAGMYNTQFIIPNQGAGSYAAKLCADYAGGGFGDWYLPSKNELQLLYSQKALISGITNNNYWSSTEISSTNAWYQFFGNGFQGSTTKPTSCYVRAIRAF